MLFPRKGDGGIIVGGGQKESPWNILTVEISNQEEIQGLDASWVYLNCEYFETIG